MTLLFAPDLDSHARLLIHRLYNAGELLACSYMAQILGRWRSGHAADDTLQAAFRLADGILGPWPSRAIKRAGGARRGQR